MSTVGHDIGNRSSRMTVCDWRIDVGYNTEKVWTPDHLCRYSTSDLQGYLSQIKLLLGWKFSDPELQLELDFLPFRVIEGPNGSPLVHSKCMGENRAFTPIDILAMLISYIESLASEEHPLYYTNFPCCIGVPIYFTDEQRKDVLEAAKLARLTSFSLLDETTAMALGYENSCHSASAGIVAFVDIGHANMQVCFAQFETTIGPVDVGHTTVCTKILYQAYVRSLGGRDFNKVLFMHFASMIRKEYGIDVYQSANACLRLSDACESLKKELSKYTMASFCIKKFSGSKDVKGSIKRNEFENMMAPILERIKESLEKALADSGLNRCRVQSIETVGNGCSMPAVINILKEVFEMEPRKMTNSDEYIARGCAISQVPWIARWRTMTTGLKTSELVSNQLNSEEEKVEDSDKFLWRRAMGEEGHLLTFLNDFLEKNMHRIGRSEKTKDELDWLSKAKDESFKLGAGWFGIVHKGILHKISSVAIKMLNAGSSRGAIEFYQERDDRTNTAENEKMQNNPDNANEERPALQLSEAQKLIEQLISERDGARKQVEELCQLTEQQAHGSQSVGYFSEYSYSELQDATNNFHKSFKLGEGGFGIVYKGILHNTTIAIKILKEGSSQGAKEFHQETEILSKVRHPNLVTLIGACAETRALIYEYLPNGSLEDRLRCKNNTPPLSWQVRVRIAFEICSALSFLHCSKPHGIVHGDLKPDNILLDMNDVSKIGDFGLCRQLNWTNSASIPYHWTGCPKGTFAYMDPEYLSTGKTTPQYDVYSFGIILLQLVTCKDPRGIRSLVEEAQKKGTLKALIDASAGPWPFKEAKKMISLGLRCSDLVRKNRPDLSTKVWKEIKSMAHIASALVSL